MKRKIFAFALATMILASLTTTVFAADSRSPYELPYDVETGKLFDCVASVVIGDDVHRDSIAVGRLHCDDPLFGYPEGYAYMEAKQTSYKVRAKCDVNSNGLGVTTTGWKEMNNTTSCNSGTVKAKTAKCIFTGFFGVQVTSTSDYYEGEQSRSFE